MHRISRTNPIRTSFLGLLALLTVLGLSVSTTAVATVVPTEHVSGTSTSGTLFGATGGNATSDLYTVNPSTGETTAIGPIGFAITGMAFDPTTGILYGSTSTASPSDPKSLITIDPATGTGTLVGPYGISGSSAADIAFNSAGQLFGWIEDPDDLVSINKGTGAATVVGDSGLSTFGDGMDFNQTDVLYAMLQGAGDDLYNVNTTTGAATATLTTTIDAAYDGFSVSSGSFTCDDDNIMSVTVNNSGDTHLFTLDVTTGVMTQVGATRSKLDGLVWDCSPSDAELAVKARNGGKKLKPGKKTKIIKSATSNNAAVTKVKTKCYLHGNKLTGKDKKAVCKVITKEKSNGERRVKVKPHCSVGVKISTKIVANADDLTKTTWSRTWNVKNKPRSVCSLNGNG